MPTLCPVVRLFLILVAAIPLFAQSPTIAPPPNATVNAPDFSKEANVVEQFTQRIKFQNDGTSTDETYSRTRIQSDAGVQRFGLLTFSYATGTGTFEIEYVRVRKPDGTTVETTPDSIQDMPSEITSGSVL